MKKRDLSLRSVMLLGMLAVGLVSLIVFSVLLYSVQTNGERDQLINISDAVMHPIANLATRGINGGNVMKLRGADAQALYKSSGLKYLSIDGMSKAMPKTAFAGAMPPKPVTYSFIGENEDAAKLKSMAATTDALSIDEERWLLIVHQKLPDVVNGGKVVAIFSARALEGSVMRTIKSVLFVALPVLLITVLFAVFLGRLISRPIVSTSQQITEISETLNLTSRVDISASNEVGDIAKAFNYLLDKVQEIMLQVDESSASLTCSAETLKQSVVAASQRIQDQEVQTENVATAMNEMTAVVDVVAENANSASEAAQRANVEATNGQSVVSNTAKSINDLAQGVEAANSAIERAGEDSQNIGGVLDVIRGIAEQTNLLALNAAIEAARAGESGRGFAVVADEVRSLAGRTQQATEEINEMISRLQAGVKEAVEVIGKSQVQAKVSVEQANEAGNSLQEITASVITINDMNAQIALSAKEQAAMTEDVNCSISRINELTEHASADSQSCAASSEQLAELAANLTNLVHQFKL
ncbi:MAG: methyl-accepting chemotaxis protein [Candidatus Polarisedimenticolaceae bacterium]|nr:methyl-accepting chemotaxis protein [Candidatus Polarisedimenticolaceae bacterium]